MYIKLIKWEWYLNNFIVCLKFNVIYLLLVFSFCICLVILYWFLGVKFILVNRFIIFVLDNFINNLKLMLFLLNSVIKLFKFKLCSNVLIVLFFIYVVIFKKKWLFLWILINN